MEIEEHIEVFRDSIDPKTIRLHAKALKEIGSPKAIEALIEHGVLRRSGTGMDRIATKVLGELGDKAVPQLMKAIGRTIYKELVMDAIVETKSHKAAKMLIKKLENKDNSVWSKRRVITTLGRLRFPEACGPIIEHGILHQDVNTASKALVAVSNIGTEKGIESLVWGLMHDDRMVQRQAENMLDETLLKKERGINKKDESTKSFAYNMLTAGSFTNTLKMPKAEEGLKHSTGYVAALTARALGTHIYKENAIKLLTEIGAKHKNPLVRAMTLHSLWEHKSTKAERTAINLLSDKNHQVQIYAIMALADIGTKKCLPHLMTLTGHEDWRVNDLVKKAIKQIQEAQKRGHD